VAMQDDAVALANATTFGLGGSIYTADLDQGAWLLSKVERDPAFAENFKK
jgi:succinate-semialdehyde dehydrogenase/glutarate-semialdehyde dehydrogenase